MKIIAVKLFQLKQLKRRNLKKKKKKKKSSSPSLNFFQVSSFQLLKLKQLHCDDLHIILSLSAVQIYDYFIYSYSFLHLRDKYELTIDQLPVGLIAQLVRALHRYRRGHGFPLKPEFFSAFFFSTA